MQVTNEGPGTKNIRHPLLGNCLIDKKSRRKLWSKNFEGVKNQSLPFAVGSNFIDTIVLKRPSYNEILDACQEANQSVLFCNNFIIFVFIQDSSQHNEMFDINEYLPFKTGNNFPTHTYKTSQNTWQCTHTFLSM